LPAGVTANPSGTFSINAGQPVDVLFGADPSAGAGQFSVAVQGTSGALSHSATLALTVQAGVAQNLPRTAFVRDDAVRAIDFVAGEPLRRTVVYDPAGQRFFAANRAMNRVEVFSGSPPALSATIDAPGASSVDISTDGSTLWAGSSTEEILAIDLGSLRVKQRYPVAGIRGDSGAVYSRPTEIVPLAGGNFLARIRQANSAQSLLALWTAATNTFTDLTSLAPGIFQSGLGVMARSGDHSRILVAANDASGNAAIFDGGGNLVAGSLALGAGTIPAAAANNDGSRFAVALNSSSGTQILLLDASLNTIANYAASAVTSLVFSRDGQTLYAGTPQAGAAVVTAFSGTNLQVLGQIPDVAVQGVPSLVEDADASNLLCALSNRGVAFLDAAAPATSLTAVAPVFGPVPLASPAEGPNAGGTTVALTGTNFPSSAQVQFGRQNPVNAAELSTTLLQATTPANASSGAADVTAYFPNGWLALAPSAFSYGPKIERVLPNAGSASGGDTITILGFGFGTASGSLSVSIGGQAAAVQKVEALPAFAASLGLDANYPFAMERITVTTTAGTAGKADISVTAPSGMATAAKAFQFMQSMGTFAAAGLHKFVLYGPSRQQVYLSSTDHLDVYSISQQTFTPPMDFFPDGPPPNASLRGMALTPDATQLIVADFGEQSIFLVNPDGAANSGVKVPVGGVSGFLNSGPARVGATSAGSVFVGLSGEGDTSSACNGCLGQVDLSAATPSFTVTPQNEVATLTGAPLLALDALGDTGFFSFGSAFAGPLARWSAATPNSFNVSATQSVASDLAEAADGDLFAVRENGATEIRNAGLSMIASPVAAELERVPGRVAVPGVTLHPSGALLYEPFLDGAPPAAPPATGIYGGIDIRDAHNGALRLRIHLPEPFAMLATDIDGMHGDFLTTDENGQTLFAATVSGLTIVKLANVPLGIGSLMPSSGIAAGGVSVTLRGSGFVSGTQVTLGGKSAQVTFKDMNTLIVATPTLSPGPQQIVVSNPDGESVSLDAAYTAQ
jgi:hypothetical protein